MTFFLGPKKTRRAKIDLLEKSLAETRESSLAVILGQEARAKILLMLFFSVFAMFLLGHKLFTPSARLGSIASLDIKARVNFESPSGKTILRGATLVQEGEKITVEKYLLLEKENGLFFMSASNLEKLGKLGGLLLCLFISAVLFVVCLRLFAPEILESSQRLGIYGFLCLSIPLLTRLFYETLPYLGSYFPEISPYIVPLAIPAAMLVLAYGARAAIVGVTAASFLSAGVAGADLYFGAVMLTGSLVAVLLLARVRRRLDPLIAGLLAGLGYFLTALGIGLFNQPSHFALLVTEALWGLGNGIMVGFIVTGILPLIESWFGALTDISLRELTDQDRPLLKLLIMRAPNTYAHSLNVANLAEAGAAAIHANPLLARVAAIYHDVGKLTKPDYYAENIIEGTKSRHSMLTPAMSTLVILSHVKDGSELADEYDLPNAIREVIDSHHGTSLVEYFYHTALQQKKEHEVLNEAAFRYPGPRPATAESAILMMADSVEAACRSLSDPTPQRIRNLVHTIITHKLNDHQLDECPLTLNDLTDLENSFVRVLTSMHHYRPKYPDSEPKQDSKQDSAPAPKPAK